MKLCFHAVGEGLLNQSLELFNGYQLLLHCKQSKCLYLQAVDNLKIKYISPAQILEEIVLSTKTRIKDVIVNNIRGTSRLVTFI